MHERDVFQARRKTEKEIFLRVIRALPEGKLDYKPHEKSPTALQILTTMVAEHDSCARLVEKGRTDFIPAAFKSVAEAAAVFEKNWDELDRQVAAMDLAAWDRNGQFFSGGKMVSEQPIGGFLWMILFDAVHHRGQLTTYIRPMGGKVPPIYGPSGDSRGT
jgi:uncharacterized damage-inducible protein DinB